MFQTLVSFFKTKEVRNKIFFTLAMLVIFKIGTYIPAPGVNPEPLNNKVLIKESPLFLIRLVAEP